MTEPVVRDWRTGDIEAIDALTSEVLRIPTSSAQRLNAWVREAADGFLVAEVDGRLAGRGLVAQLPMFPENSRALMVLVAPSARRRGAGSALWEALLPYVPVGVERLMAFSDDRDDEAVLNWVDRRGFRQYQYRIESRVELPSDPAAPPLDAGIQVDHLDPDATVDEPEIAELYEVSDTSPDTRADGSRGWAGLVETSRILGGTGLLVVARTDGRPVALALARHAQVDTWHVMYTGVAPAYRGRGLAYLIKSHLHAALAGRGARVLLTDNEATNAGILAVNERLGYRKLSGTRRYARNLVEAPLR